jgi:hypothetical protein
MSLFKNEVLQTCTPAALEAMVVRTPRIVIPPLEEQRGVLTPRGIQQGRWFFSKVPTSSRDGKKCQAHWSSRKCGKVAVAGAVTSLPSLNSFVT